MSADSPGNCATPQRTLPKFWAGARGNMSYSNDTCPFKKNDFLKEFGFLVMMRGGVVNVVHIFPFLGFFFFLIGNAYIQIKGDTERSCQLAHFPVASLIGAEMI